MLAKFIIQSICILSVVFLELFGIPTREQGIAFNSQGTLFRHETPLRALELTEQEKPHSIERFSSLVSIPLDDLWKRISFEPTEKRSKILENWHKNQDKVQSLYQDSQELSAIFSEIRHEWRNSAMLNIYSLVRYYFWGHNVIEGLSEFKRKIALLKQARLRELGLIELPTFSAKLTKSPPSRHDPAAVVNAHGHELPGHISHLIARRASRGLGEEILHDFKTHILENKLFFARLTLNYTEPIVILWWKYALKAIDLLLKNEFIDQKTVRDFFQDPLIIRKLTDYIELRLQDDIGDSIMYASSKLNEHWYWSLWHECFKALGKKEETLLQGHVLLQRRYPNIVNLMNKLSTFSGNKFLQSWAFEPSLYLEQLRSNTESLSSKTQQKMNEDVGKIIETVVMLQKSDLVSRADKLIILRYWFAVIDFLEEFESPDAMEKKILTHPSARHFGDLRKIFKLDIQLNDLIWNQRNYLENMKLESAKDWFSGSTHVLLMLDEYLAQLNQKLTQFKNESAAFRLKWQREESLSHIFTLISNEESRFNKSYVQLRDWKNAFIAANGLTQ